LVNGIRLMDGFEKMKKKHDEVAKMIGELEKKITHHFMKFLKENNLAGSILFHGIEKINFDYCGEDWLYFSINGFHNAMKISEDRIFSDEWFLHMGIFEDGYVAVQKYKAKYWTLVYENGSCISPIGIQVDFDGHF
jgi:hypothetical protein